MTIDDQYVPSWGEVRSAYVSRYLTDQLNLTDRLRQGAEFDRFLARVRRDAAANALYEVAIDIDNYDDYLMVHNRAKRIEETP